MQINYSGARNRHLQDWIGSCDIKYTAKHWSILLFQNTLFDYAKAGDPNFENSTTLMMLSSSISTIVIILEMICYVVFFHSIYKHNNSTTCLPAETRKSRNRSNAQTMMSQMYFFLLDLLLMIINAIALGTDAKQISKDIAVTFKILELIVVSVIHCLFIPEFRMKIMKPFKTLLSKYVTWTNDECAIARKED